MAIAIASGTEKHRRMARNHLEETFTAIFKQALEDPSKLGAELNQNINLNDPVSFATEVEECLFVAYNNAGVPSDQVFFIN